MTKKISIIMPNLNTEESYLRTCFNSILSQSLNDIEVLVIDNGSDELTLNILKDYEERYDFIKLLFESNGRQGKARNLGIKHAQGEYIAFLDSDDWLSPNACEILYDIAKKDNLDILKTNYYVYEQPVQRMLYKKLLSNPCHYGNVYNIKTKREILYGNPYIWNGLYKTRFLKDNNILFNESCVNEDHLFFWQTNILAERFKLVGNAEIYYRKYPTSTSKGIYSDAPDIIKIFKLIEKFLEEKGIIDDYKDIFLQKRLSTYTYLYRYLEGDKLKAMYFEEMLKVLEDLDEKSMETLSEADLLRAFLIKSKNIDCWNKYQFSIKLKDQHSPENFQYKLNRFKKELQKALKENKNKKICLYGAGEFSQELLLDNTFFNNSDIVGILDKNDMLEGSELGGYQVFLPQKILDLKPDIIIPIMLFPNAVKGFLTNMQYFYDMDFDVIYL
ncbi:MAG: glycosyltransferase [Candidatus Gastranaerophilales bacterium]|nr:glycosyltransferase [Candidatus Gastranaerophilales bacterium]